MSGNRRNHRSIVRNDGGDLGLLQHHFGNENGVGIAGAAPGKIASVFSIPARQRAAKLSGLFFGEMFRFARHDRLKKTTVNVFTAPLNLDQIEKLRALLEELGFTFAPKPYTIFFAQKNKLSVAVYEKGPKVFLQGKGIEEFVQFELEPKILGEARLGYEEVHSPEMFEPHFGIDESGKGDFFGPLVIAGVFSDRGIARKFLEAGMQDSKRIGSDARIRALAKIIRQNVRARCSKSCRSARSVTTISIEKFGNLNSLLGWGHARVIENLLAKKPDCPRALVGQICRRACHRKCAPCNMAAQFSSSSGPKRNRIWRWRRLRSWRGKPSSTGSRNGAERWECELGRGVSAEVKKTAQEIVVDEGGPRSCEQLAKVHFRTAHEIAPDHFAAPPPRREWRK